MILSMSHQARLFIYLVLTGMAAGLFYDLIRVFRRLIPHGFFAVQAEDFIYWVLFALGVMAVLLWEDNGVLRAFSILAPLIGLILYFCLLSGFIIKPAELIIRLVKRLFMVILHILYAPIAFALALCLAPTKKILYKFNKIVKNLLKNLGKYAKIIKGFLNGKLFKSKKPKLKLKLIHSKSRKSRSDSVEGRSRKKEKK